MYKMRTIFTLLILLFVSVSCKNDKPVPEAEKDKIKAEIKEIVNRMFKGNEEANVDMVIEPFLDSPDFVYIIHGYALNYKQLVEGIKPIFKTLSSQKVTIVDEKFAFINKTTVLYTVNCKLQENFRDGHSSLNDPTAILYVFCKTGGKWKIIYGAESFVKQGVSASENP
jgi:hypothetical protein